MKQLFSLAFSFALINAYALPPHALTVVMKNYSLESTASLKPVITYREEAKYPQEAIEAGIHGFVVLKPILFSNGTIGSVQLVLELPEGLTQTATDAIYQIRFKPGLKNGNPVSVRTEVAIPFQFDYSDETRLKRGLTFAFPYLSESTIANLAEAFNKDRPDSFTADNWTISCDQEGSQLWSTLEQEEYIGLKREAIKQLPSHLQNFYGVTTDSTQSVPGELINVSIENTKTFRGMALLSVEKQKRFGELHSRAITLGLKNFIERSESTANR